jgi:hypothetical protein
MHTIYNIQRNIEQKEVVFKEKYKKQRQKALFPYSKEKATACSKRAGGKNGGIT